MPARLADDREAALRAGYAATTAPPIPFEQYVALLDDWDVKAIVKDDKCIGAAYLKGPEFHVSVLPEWHGRWMNRRVLHDILGAPDARTTVKRGTNTSKTFFVGWGLRNTPTDRLRKVSLWLGKQLPPQGLTPPGP